MSREFFQDALGRPQSFFGPPRGHWTIDLQASRGAKKIPCFPGTPPGAIFGLSGGGCWGPLGVHCRTNADCFFETGAVRRSSVLFPVLFSLAC